MAVNDAKTFGIWKSGSKCDSIEGMQEPSMTPPLQYPLTDAEDTSFSILVSLMCRSVKFQATQTTVDYSPMAKATRMVPDNKTYHQSSPDEGLQSLEILPRFLPGAYTLLYLAESEGCKIMTLKKCNFFGSRCDFSKMVQ